MPIGTSDGEYFDNHFEAMVEGNAKTVSSVDSTMPPGGSTEPAGALNPDTGTQQPVRPVPYGLNPPEKGPGFSSNEERPPAKVLYKTASPLVNITDHDIEDATNIAMSAGPATIMGVQSKTFNFDNLHKASAMELAKEHPDKIWQETGTFLGADAWARQEIPDIGSALKKENMHVQTDIVNNPTGWSHVANHGTVLETVGIKPADRIPLKDVAPPKDINDFDRWYKEFSGDKAKPTILRDVLDHPELYKAYPELENLKLYNLKDYKGGLGGNIEGVHTDDGIFMKNANPTQFRSVLLHEVQHAIQKIENFGRGGNPGMFKPEALIPVEESFNKIKQEALSDISKRTSMNHFDLGLAIGVVKSNLERGVAPDAGNMFKGLVEKLKSTEDFEKIVNIAKSQKLLDDAAKEWFEKYQRLAGEVESRNVQKRADMIRLERKYQSPMDTEDRPRSMQIVR